MKKELFLLALAVALLVPAVSSAFFVNPPPPTPAPDYSLCYVNNVLSAFPAYCYSLPGANPAPTPTPQPPAPVPPVAPCSYLQTMLNLLASLYHF